MIASISAFAQDSTSVKKEHKKENHKNKGSHKDGDHKKKGEAGNGEHRHHLEKK